MALSSVQAPFVNPVIPFSRVTKSSLQYGHHITVKVIFLQASGTRFAVNFQTGFSNNDIAFHFNPRFEDDGYVVCNTKQNGRWGKEERKKHMPFQMDIPFEISFLVENFGFHVKVNGKDFLKYEHRVPHHIVDTISFTGGVEVKHFSMQNPCEVSVQKMISEVQSNPSPCGSPEAEEEKPKPPSYWQAITAPDTQTVINIVQNTPGQ